MAAVESLGTYSSAVGAIYVFNLIVGTGALTMPIAFAKAGWVLSILFLSILAFLSYITATFVIEAMSIGNAIKRVNSDMSPENRSVSESERTPLLLNDTEEAEDESQPRCVFSIIHQLELAHLATYVLPKIGVFFFYLSIIVYLFGDLTIYAAAAPKSVRDVICTYQPTRNHSIPHTTIAPEFSGLELDLSFNNSTPLISNASSESSKCWENSNLRRIDVYRICVAVFYLLLGPFVFFDVSKTKYMQILTTALRWLAFSIMLVLTVIRLAKGEGRGHPVMFNLIETPAFLGIVVYSFMCHHSLPAMITPVRQKHHITYMMFVNFFVILLFYCALSLTEIFSFEKLEDLATLNFQPSHVHPITNVKFFQYFLALFPAFTLSTNFPIIGVTLRNNLQKLCSSFTGRLYPLGKRIVFSLVVLIPPFIISMSTDNVSILVQITGGYAGVGIQYLVPTALVFFGRREIFRLIPDNIEFDIRYKQIHRSFFSHWFWMLIIVTCAILIYVSTTYKFLMMLIS